MLNILQEWCKFSNFDPLNPNASRTYSFSFGSEFNTTYEIKRRNEALFKFIRNWDISGLLSTIYAKRICKLLLEHQQISLLEIVENSSKIKSSQNIWKQFTSEEFNQYSTDCNKMLHNFLDKLTDVKFIGEERDYDENIFLESLEKVILDCDKLNIESYCKDTSNIEISNFCPYIIVCDTLAECLVKLSNSSDGVYICYIANSWKIDGWFGFFVKSKNNLFSVNERLWEAYKGQHNNSRNGRYAENKCYELFPYELVTFSGSDYKGYATEAKIEAEKTHILQTQSGLNIAIMLLVIYLRFNNSSNTLENVYVDSLLPQNITKTLSSPEVKSLMVIDNTNALIEMQKQVAPVFDITVQDIITNQLGEKLNYDSNSPDAHLYDEQGKCTYYKKYGIFSGLQQELVDMFGYDFELNSLMNYDLKLLTQHNVDLTVDKDTQFCSELVGTAETMKVWAYYDARKQLAEHLKKNIQKEFEEFGGRVAVENWFKEQCEKHIQQLIDYCVSLEAQSYHYNSVYGIPCNSDFRVIKNVYTDYDCRKLCYPGRNAYAYSTGVNNVEFNISFLTADAFNLIFGKDNVPKICSVYKYIREHDGNSLLSATDMVSQVKMPYEPSHGSFSSNGADYVSFDFDICISKRDLRKLVTFYKKNKHN